MATVPPVTINGVDYPMVGDDSVAIKIPFINAILRALAGVNATESVRAGLYEGLVSYWRLGEVSGSRADSIGSNTLTDNNTVTQADGKLGKAGQFTAANSEYLSIADNASLSTGDIDFTFCAWVYADSLGANRFIVTKSNLSTLGEYFLAYSTATSRFRFAIQNASTFVTIDADVLGAPSTATWYFIVGWHDSVANTVNIQVNNGTANSGTTGATVPADSAQAFQLGAQSVPGDYWNGRIDSVGFWKRVLTAAERTALYNYGAGRAYPF